MKYKQHKQYRHPNYDYSQNGYYFVTVCTRSHREYFGEIIKLGDEISPIFKMRLSEIGKIAQEYWLEIPNHFPFVKLDEYMIMPNHVHGIIIIDKVNNNELSDELSVGTQNFVFLQHGNKFGPQSGNLASIIRGYKIGVTKYAKENNIVFSWQTRYYDRIIRNEQELDKIRQYIINNPTKWELEKNNPDDLFV